MFLITSEKQVSKTKNWRWSLEHDKRENGGSESVLRYLLPTLDNFTFYSGLDKFLNIDLEQNVLQYKYLPKVTRQFSPHEFEDKYKSRNINFCIVRT